MEIIEKLKKIAGYIVHLKRTRLLLSMHNNGYLCELGWFESFDRGEPLDRDLKPIPWATYSYIAFIQEYLKPDMKIFEFGSGNSTLFYASHTQKVVTIEHNSNWYQRMMKKIPAHVELIFEPDGPGKYSRCLPGLNQKFDVIIVDGINRNECLKNLTDSLNENGLIVLDDSERTAAYEEGIDFLLSAGFRKIDFWGIAPRYFHNKCTSVFYRNKI